MYRVLVSVVVKIAPCRKALQAGLPMTVGSKVAGISELLNVLVLRFSAWNFPSAKRVAIIVLVSFDVKVHEP